MPQQVVILSFHSTITDNNLFCPLGWTPPRPKEPYRLFGTILPTDRDPQAILQATADNKIHTVTRGDTLDTDTIIRLFAELCIYFSRKSRHYMFDCEIMKLSVSGDDL